MVASGTNAIDSDSDPVGPYTLVPPQLVGRANIIMAVSGSKLFAVSPNAYNEPATGRKHAVSVLDLVTGCKSGTTHKLVTTAVPSGTVSFRAVASAPGFTPAISAVRTQVVQPGVDLSLPSLTKFTVSSGTLPSVFTVNFNPIAGYTLYLQSSLDGTTWSNVQGVTDTVRLSTHTLKTSAVPENVPFFRVVASASGQPDKVSASVSLFKPDLSVAPVTAITPKAVVGKYVGASVYNLTTVGQQVKAMVARGSAAYFAFNVTNTSKFTDIIWTSAFPSEPEFTMQWFAQGGTTAVPTLGAEITSEITGSQFVQNYPAGSTFVFYLKVYVGSTATKGKVLECPLNTVSTYDSRTQDSARVTVTASNPVNTVFVRNTNDTGPGTLRTALTYAATHPHLRKGDRAQSDLQQPDRA